MGTFKKVPIVLFGVPYEIRTRVIAVKGRCPRPLDEGDFVATFLFGGGKRDRTADLLHAMQALSQLSYTPQVAPKRARIIVMASDLVKRIS
jgi:hypothetical protein